MRKLLITLAYGIVLPFISAAQKNISVIGSSTAAGDGASVPESTYVNRVKAYYKGLKLLDTIYNLAVPGTTTFSAMPSSYVPGPLISPVPPLPDPAHNVTRAIALNPAVVIVGFPSNDLLRGWTVRQYLTNLHTIYDSVLKTGKNCYVTTTQPRNDIDPHGRQELKDAGDTILMEFPGHALNFWAPLVDPLTLGIQASLTNGGIHPNDAGHRLLAQVVINANVLQSNPLALDLTAFTAIPGPQGIVISWTAVNSDGAPDPANFEVQRSGDGAHFEDIFQRQADPEKLPVNYSWVDSKPLIGKNLYRLRWVTGSIEHFSRIVSVTVPENGLSIGKIYFTPGKPALTAEIYSQTRRNLRVMIISMSGMIVGSENHSIIPPSGNISLDITSLAAGHYFLTVRSPEGEADTKAFMKF